jgi:hypothetical protein
MQVAEALTSRTPEFVMANAKTDIVQRAAFLRQKHQTGLVVDIVDVHRVFKNQYRSEAKYYSVWLQRFLRF